MPQQSPRFGYAATDFPLEDYSTGLVTAQAVRYLEQHRHEPFALWVSFPDPHTPYEAPRRYVDMFPPDKIHLPPWREGEFDETAPERNRVFDRLLGLADEPLEEIYNVLAVYYAMVRFLDDGLGQILAALENLGLRERTIVVFCADHGDFAGEHRLIRKGGLFYDAMVRVPLILAWPGQVPAGQVDRSLVNLVDVVPTLLQLQGLDIPRSMQGQPLPMVTETLPRDAAFSEYGAGGPPFRLADLARLPEPYGLKASKASLQWREAEGRRKMVRTHNWKYVHDPMGDRDELYDLARDPGELYNVIDDPAHAEVVAELRLRLLDWSITTEDSHPVPLP